MTARQSLLKKISSRAGLENPEWRAFLTRWLAIGLALHLAAAWFSVGFYDLDEHFQVVEFVGKFLGRARAELMPWEFGLQQRPWVQPIVYAALAKVWLLLGVQSTRIWMASFRAVSAVMGWTAGAGLSLCAYRWFKEERFRRLAVRMLVLLWLLPYLDARTSSESFSAALFFMGVSCVELLGIERWSCVLAGFLFALSGYARYQIGPMLIGMAAWLVLVARVPRRQLGWMLGGSCVALAVGLSLDRVGYGFWTCAPWNHLNLNVLHGYAANRFGSQPWWFYPYFVGEYLPLLSAPLGLAAACGWLTRPKHVLTWCTLPLFVMLSAVSHKELRFLFPMSLAAPFLAVFAIEWISHREWPRVARAMGRGTFGFLAAANGVVLLGATLKPSSVQNKLYDFVFDHWPDIREVHYVSADPYNLGGCHVQFYNHPGFRTVHDESWGAIDHLLSSGEPELWVFNEHFELPEQSGPLKARCQLAFSVFPEWLKKFMFIPGIRNSASKWSVFRCTR